MLVSLLTDFGTGDYFVGAMKAVILGRCPGATLVDITHDIAPQDLRAAAFTLLAAYDAFPAPAVHLVVVDPGVGSERRAIVASDGSRHFVAPDNGVLGYVLEREPQISVVHARERRFFREPLSSTFHGRDLFAPVAAALACGVSPAELGPRVDDAVRLEPIRPRPSEDGLRGTVLHVDRFGNCITSFTRRELPRATPDRPPRLRAGDREVEALRRFFAEPAAEPDAPFAIWGSAGFLEIAVNRGSAADRLGLRAGDPVLALPTTEPA